MQRKWIQTATIAVDSETGAILVSGAGGGGGVEIVGLKDASGDQVNPATKEAVDAIAAALADPAQSGEAEAAAALIVAALESPAQAGEADAAAGNVVTALGSPAQEDGALADVKARVGPSDGVQSSGTTAKATTDDNPVQVLAEQADKTTRGVRVHNTGVVAGFFSIDGGTTWHYLPASFVIEWYVYLGTRPAVQIKRIAGGSNLTGVYAERW